MLKSPPTVWQKTVGRDQVTDHMERYNVISTRLFAGQTILHVLSDSSPGADFEAISAELEDVYFATMKGNGVGGEQKAA